MTDLLETQNLLQAEADDLVRELDLESLLGALGRPVRVGSSAMGLMVRRDIDITVICLRLNARTLELFSGLAARLMQNSAVGGVRFRNDTGHWNKEPAKYPDGLYVRLTVLNRNAATWTFDIWAVDQPDRQPDLAHLRTLLPRLTEAHRRTILEIKHVLVGDASIPSALVYEAVVDHDVRNAEQFKAWRLTRSG